MDARNLAPTVRHPGSYNYPLPPPRTMVCLLVSDRLPFCWWDKSFLANPVVSALSSLANTSTFLKYVHSLRNGDYCNKMKWYCASISRRSCCFRKATIFSCRITGVLLVMHSLITAHNSSNPCPVLALTDTTYTTHDPSIKKPDTFLARPEFMSCKCMAFL